LTWGVGAEPAPPLRQGEATIKRTTLALGLAVAIVCLVAGPAAQASRTERHGSMLVTSGHHGVATSKDALQSSNWAGYAVADASTAQGVQPGASAPDPNAPPQPTTAFTSVTATWTQPVAMCKKDTPTYSATWVGLGGFSATSQALEQIGADSDCSASGKPVYNAWYELVPAPSVPINMKVAAGDTITTSVNINGSTVLLQIKNRTRRTSFTKSFTVAAPDMTSAEWIVEAPSTCTSSQLCKTLPLANFGSVTFTRIATTGNTHAGTLVDPAWLATPIQLLTGGDVLHPDASQSGAVPAAPTPDGRSFTVTWQPETSTTSSG
jgi:hypothetical protein